MKNSLFTKLKIIYIIFILALIVSYVILRYQIKNSSFESYMDIFNIWYYLANVWTHGTGVLISIKALCLIKEGKKILSIPILLAGILIIQSAAYIVSRFVFFA